MILFKRLQRSRGRRKRREKGEKREIGSKRKRARARQGVAEEGREGKKRQR